jgi:beta-N-acetylhexosaminidase
MTLPEKAGQLIFLKVPADPAERAAALQHLPDAVRRLHIGGLKIQVGDLDEHVQIANTLQGLSRTPLLLCADFERGVGERFEGAVRFPPPMALGAIDDPNLTWQIGHAIAAESRAVGISLMFVPVVDVNNNPANPAINVRSFGENPHLVAQHASAFIRGAHDAGVLATAKHFPGHGDVSEDSHLNVAQSLVTAEQLHTQTLVPFDTAIQAGVDAMMSAHLALPKLGLPADMPATLSYEIITGLLRHQLGFQGVVITDSMEMWPIRKNYSPGEAASRAVMAGADIILDVLDAEAAIHGILECVRTGAISLARLDESVRRILTLKAKAGIQNNSRLDLKNAKTGIGKPETHALFKEVASRALTLVRDARSLLPIHLESDAKIALLDIFSEGAPRPLSPISTNFQRRWPNAQAVSVSGDTLASCSDHILSTARDADLLVWNMFIGPACYSGKIGLPAALAPTLHRLQELHKPVIAISFGNPYIVLSAPFVNAYLCAYDESAMIQEAVFDALISRARISGKLPVTIPGYSKN